MDAVAPHGDVNGRAGRRHRIARRELDPRAVRQIERNHAVGDGTDAAAEHVLATHEAGDIGG
jgi:hypothetical protein